MSVSSVSQGVSVIALTSALAVSATALNVTSSGNWKCGGYSTKMECEGFAVGLCHSGTNPECSNQKNCGEGTYAAVQCSSDQTDVDKSSVSHWHFGSYGEHLSCVTTTGSAATGACGGGMNPDCASGKYFGIDCRASKVKVVADTCEWTYHKWGEYISCPSSRPILAGSCSGGANPDCHGHYFATQCCAESSHAIKVTGSWKKRQYSSGSQTVSYSMGTTKSHTTSSTNTIGASISSHIETGCEILGVGGKVSIDSEISSSLAKMDRKTFAQTRTDGYSTTFPAGQVWQWEWDAEMSRGTANTWGSALVHTAGAYAMPCCLPGYFVDATKASGACHGSSPILCNSLQV